MAIDRQRFCWSSRDAWGAKHQQWRNVCFPQKIFAILYSKTAWTTSPYLLHAYDVTRTSFQRYRKTGGRAQDLDSKPTRNVDRGTVIDCQELSKEIYCASFFYVRKMIRTNCTPSSIEKRTAKQEYWKKVWDVWIGRNIQRIGFERFDFLAREHDACMLAVYKSTIGGGTSHK